jgi:hypothetical protein
MEYSHGAVEGNMFVLEGAYYDFGKIEEVLKVYGMNRSDFHLIGLVQCEKSKEDFLSDFRKYDTEDDWTYNLSDEELEAVAEDAVVFNEEMYRQLSEHGFTIYDTSKDRDDIFDGIIESIRE